MTLPQARDRANELSRIYRAGTTDLHAHVARAVAAEQARLVAEDAAAARELALATSGSLKRLLSLYLEHLAGKRSERDVHNNLTLHVPTDLLQRRASELGTGDFLPLISGLVEAGKGRTASKLRTNLRAAYELALSSLTEPGAPQALREMGVDHNPVASVSTRSLRQFNRTRERSLDEHEFGAFITRAHAMRVGRPEPHVELVLGGKAAVRDFLLLTLFLGGQREEQLLRLEFTYVDLPGCTLTLIDGKGRRILPRVHELPLVPQALALLKPHVTAARLMGVPSVWGGMHPSTLTHAVADMSATMVAAGEAKEPFQLRDLRRTCETQLAALKVPKDVRAQLQSHGLGGVQDRHYDRHHYMPEKRAALLKFAKHLERLKSEHLARASADSAD